MLLGLPSTWASFTAGGATFPTSTTASIPAAVVALRRGEGTGVQLGIGDRGQEECDLLLRRVRAAVNCHC